MSDLQLVLWLENARSLLKSTVTSELEANMAGAVEALSSAIRSEKLVLVCGNGGSSADAQHIVGELVGRFLRERKPFPAICLSSNSAVLTAWSNDYSFETVFSRQVEAYIASAGIVIGLSTSGNSKNVVEAMSVAKRNNIRTIGFTGQGGGQMRGVCDHLLSVESTSTPAIQQVHVCLYHFLCARVEEIVARQS